MSTISQVTADLERQAIELPSWAFGNSGTRFKVFAQPGVPRDPFEKVTDAAQVHQLTGLAPSIALHIPWDLVDDVDKLRAHAEDHGLRLGTINTNTFQDDDYKFGSFCHVDDRIRQKAVQHALDCVDVMDVTGSRDLKVWLPDGLNYPGQGDLRDRQERLADSLQQVYARLGDHQRLVLEYKFFEPAFYATDVPDWGTAYVHCAALGDRAVVCLDTGHHAPGTNIEFIVMQLLRLGKLGAFDFNSRFYADDDLIVGAADPFQLFRILVEVVRGGGYDVGGGVSFMLDQCHNIEPKIPGQIRSVLNVQEMTARALLVDRTALDEAEREGDVLAGNAVMMDAFSTDVRADLAEWRASRGFAADPIAAYAQSGYAEQIAAERVGGDQAGSGRVSVVDDLVARSNRLGADPRTTNYGGGNTSATGIDVDPVTGSEVELLWVKGSGGDLGTLTADGLAVLRLDRVRSLVDVYPGEDREDEMVAAFDFCRHGLGGAAPSIDTAMHALVDAAHVDHLHPDAGIAIATAVDGEALTKDIFGDEVVWVPWRRPGFQLGLDIAAVQAANPAAIGVILGGHGITAWGATSDEAEANSRRIIDRAQAHLDAHGDPTPFGPVVDERRPLGTDERRAAAAALAPRLRAIASRDHRMVGHFTDSDEVLEFLAGEKLHALAELGTSCPDHFLRTKVKPLVVPADASPEVLAQLHEQYRADYRAYYERHAQPDSPAMRGADPAIVLVPGVGMFSYGKDKATARVAGEFYVNAINVMRGAESVSTYAPISESEKFRIEYWALEEAKLRRLPAPKRHAGRIALVTGGAGGIGKAIAEQLVAEGACVLVADLDVAEVDEDLDRLVAVATDVTEVDSVRAAVDAALLAFGGLDLVVNNAGLSISKPLLETTEEDWDLQHDVMAKGSFLVAQAAAKAMVDQGLGGDLVYVVSKNAVFAGPNNVGYSAAKADQAHQVRLLAAELGEHGIRVNGVNPDGVVRGSGIFAGGWGAERAAVYGVEEEDLGAFYAQRTLLKQEVLPEHVANAVAALCSSELSHTTGLLVPVDAGVAAAFLR